MCSTDLPLLESFEAYAFRLSGSIGICVFSAFAIVPRQSGNHRAMSLSATRRFPLQIPILKIVELKSKVCRRTAGRTVTKALLP